jgi:tetratricopeptide (TPR) repeat protein
VNDALHPPRSVVADTNLDSPEIIQLREALARDPRDVTACSQLVFELERLQRSDEAGGAWLHLGMALAARDDLQEAVVAFQQALAKKSNCLRAHIWLGRVQHLLGQPHEAIRSFEAAIEIDPGNVQAHVELGRAFHYIGDHERGWAGFAHSFNREALSHQALEQPSWDGTPIAGRAILVRENFGLGDAILFLRYVRFLKLAGARIILEADRRLGPLLRPLAYIDRFIQRGTPLPAFDVHAPLPLLPSLVAAPRSTVPGDIPYITADDELREAWRQRLGLSTATTVGIAWAGDPKHATASQRFVSLETYAPLADVGNLRIVGLQIGPEAEQPPPSRLGVERWLNDDSTLADTAALILNLDLVITVDTMIAHLAGALGVPVWTVLPTSPSWMWQVSGDRSAWYPTMRLFRQTRRGDWAGVFARLAAELAQRTLRDPGLR